MERFEGDEMNLFYVAGAVSGDKFQNKCLYSLFHFTSRSVLFHMARGGSIFLSFFLKTTMAYMYKTHNADSKNLSFGFGNFFPEGRGSQLRNYLRLYG